MTWHPTATTVRGIRGDIEERLNAFPELWKPHVTNVDSTTQVEPFAFSGAVPKPREMKDGRKTQGLSQFSFNIENGEHELTLLIDRKNFEDQQTDSVKRRIGEMSGAWAPYKDEIFNEMLEKGNTTTQGTPHDGLSFFHDTRSQGDSGTIDNNLTGVVAAADAIPTSSEFLAAMNQCKRTMALYADDQGRKGTQMAAMMQLRVIAEVDLERPMREALQSTLIDNTDNVYGRNIAEPDFSPYLTPDATPTKAMYVHAVGSDDFKGIIYQERTPLEILIWDDPHWMDKHNGLLITMRQRFAFAYGNFRRMIKYTFTT